MLFSRLLFLQKRVEGLSCFRQYRQPSLIEITAESELMGSSNDKTYLFTLNCHANGM